MKRNKRCSNVILILVTQGGDADVAYRIARCLQKSYEKVSIFVSGFCKSAGTLVALGAHELIVSDFGELGPLDVQFTKKDELWQASSALTVMDALDTLLYQSFEMFEHYFLMIKSRSDDAITFRTATKIAAEVTIGLFTPVYQQIDPMHVGEAGRSLKIAQEYGDRLAGHCANCDSDIIAHFISHYPSHSFVIEREEAMDYFENVRGPTEAEEELCEKLGNLSRFPKFDMSDGPIIHFLSLPRHDTSLGVVSHEQKGTDTNEDTCDSASSEVTADEKTSCPPSCPEEGGQPNPSYSSSGSRSMRSA